MRVGARAPSFSVIVTDWNRARDAARPIRQRVFVEEQGVPVELEWDEHDEHSRHALALAANGEALATGRLLPDGHIGRMAVLARWRGLGIGVQIVRALIREAQRLGRPELVLHSQRHAVGFYERFGFTAQGEEFMEAGIPHVMMRARLRRDGPATRTESSLRPRS
jgi:hypothetical protein